MRVEKLYLTEAPNNVVNMDGSPVQSNSGTITNSQEYKDKVKSNHAKIQGLKDQRQKDEWKKQFDQEEEDRGKQIARVQQRKADFEKYKQKLIDVGVHPRKAQEIAQIASMDLDDANNANDKAAADKFIDGVSKLSTQQVMDFNKKDQTLKDIFKDIVSRIEKAEGTNDDAYIQWTNTLGQKLRLAGLNVDVKDTNGGFTGVVVSPKLTPDELSELSNRTNQIANASTNFKDANNKLQLGNKEPFIQAIQPKHPNAAKLLNTMKTNTLQNFAKSIGMEALSAWNNQFLKVLDKPYAAQAILTDQQFTKAYNLLYRMRQPMGDDYLDRRNAIVYFPDLYLNVKDPNFASSLIKLDQEKQYRNDNQEIKQAIKTQDYSNLPLEQEEKQSLSNAVDDLDADEQHVLGRIFGKATPDEMKTISNSLSAGRGIPKDIVAKYNK